MPTIDDHLNSIARELVSCGITLEQALEEFEGKYIGAAMDQADGNVTRASLMLGIHRNTLHNKLRTRLRVAGYVARIRKARRKPSSKKRGR